ncbi:DUF465 domain-containing protein [Sphingomonas sp. Root710]|uniref:DUF465 domain-containing protein n=1 Tax=Sphingomonas sp. Root710 TaxID=1736594 RepID=UPI0009EC417A|nr:DUF465 domain-containing protein [Sphingomonas sp. Root710]
MSDRLFRLMEHHQKLDRLLSEARQRRWIDPLEILKLKKMKLAVKDRLAAAMGRRATSA